MSRALRPLVDGYDELKLRIDRRHGPTYHVLASTRSAEASTSFEMSSEGGEIGRFILQVKQLRGSRPDASAIDEARRFGGRLFTALFRDQTYGLYRDALAQARGQNRGVRITLCLSAVPELIDIPWEFLFDDPDFLAVSAFTPVVRYLDLPRAHRPLQVEPPLRLLGLVSSPAEYEQLDVARERRNLQDALSGLIDAGAVELEWLDSPTLAALLRALQTRTFHALHYIGHGAYDDASGRGVLLFEDEAGWSRAISGDRLGMILHDFSSLRLAVLNACEGARTARGDPFAGVAGSLVQSDIPAVVAMQSEISDRAAAVFASGFYQPLAAGSPVDASVSAARLAMLADHSDDIEWGTPVLFMRVPDGRIFDLTSQADTKVRALHPGAGSATGTRPAELGPRVFVNYRRADTSGHALLLTDRLAQRFGRERIDLAEDHGSAVDRLAQVQGASAFLALIGPDWLSSLKNPRPAGRGDDMARREIEWALRDRPQSVVPVLIDASMPDPEAVPRSLRGLCRLQPSVVRHATFDQDLAALAARVEGVAGGADERHDAKPPGLDSSDATAAARLLTIPPIRNRPPSGIPQPYPDHYVDLVTAILTGTVVPVLGPGIGQKSPAVDHLNSLLAEPVASSSGQLAEVAQRVAVTLGERRLYSEIMQLAVAQSEPSEVHHFLAQLPGLLRRSGIRPRYQLIITANHDTALERAFEAANEPFDYAVYLAGSGWFVHVPWGERTAEPTATTIVEPRRYVGFPIDDGGQLERTIIVKLHGGVDGREGAVAWQNNYVVTEDHYIDYLPTHNIADHLPIQLLDKLTGSRCLFLGYVLSDWNARVFLRRIWLGKPISESSWAIEQEPDLMEKASWSVIGHVELLDAPLAEYVNTLRAMLFQCQQE